jgi:hypothetical protein
MPIQFSQNAEENPTSNVKVPAKQNPTSRQQPQ